MICMSCCGVYVCKTWDIAVGIGTFGGGTGSSAGIGAEFVVLR
jgi:hypothetical protein